MKKFKLMLGCLLLFVMGSSFVAAEEGSAPMPRIGVEGGFNLSSFNGATAGEIYASRLGFVGGLFVHFPLGPSLAIQPELLYAQKGGMINGFDYQLDYVEIPILLDINILGPLAVLLGPSFNATVASTSGVAADPTDVGLILGAQVFLSNLLVSGRYEIGLTDINSNAKVQNGTFTLLVGLAIL